MPHTHHSHTGIINDNLGDLHDSADSREALVKKFWLSLCGMGQKHEDYSVTGDTEGPTGTGRITFLLQGQPDILPARLKWDAFVVVQGYSG